MKRKQAQQKQRRQRNHRLIKNKGNIMQADNELKKYRTFNLTLLQFMTVLFIAGVVAAVLL